MKGPILIVAAALWTASAPLAGADLAGVKIPEILETILDENGEVIYEIGIEPTDPAVGFSRHHLRLREYQAAGKPGGGGGVGTDCTSTAYKTAGWHWPGPFSAKSASYASTVNAGANEWDSWTSASISGGITSGKSGEAGTYDGVNQFEWESLGASTTVAVTTTWYYRGSGVAVESDAQYNTYYSWSTSGASNAMDVGHVATHELGHTFGLNHPTSNSANACLTMYAYVSNGQTHGRTLGDGDVLGIRAIYGQ